MAVNVYCEPCRKNHTFTATQAESVIYALQAMHAEAEVSPVAYKNDVQDAIVCLNDVLDYAHEPELYSEHVKGNREARLYQHKKAQEEGK